MICRSCGLTENEIAEGRDLLEAAFSVAQFEHPAIRMGVLAEMGRDGLCSFCKLDQLDAVLIEGINPFQEEDLIQ